MNLKRILPFLALVVATQVSAQSWISDTLSMGVGYSKDAYYSLPNGTLMTPDNGDWHIALEALMINEQHGGVGIWTNEANKAGQSVKLYSLNKSGANFMAIAVADTVGKKASPLHNDTSTYAIGAFNAVGAGGDFDYGWGFYNMEPVDEFPAHSVIGDSLFLLTLNTPGSMGSPDTENAAYIVWPRAFINANEYILYARPLESSVVDTIHVSTQNANRVFRYYNFETKAVTDKEPEKDLWDFKMTNYMDLYNGAVDLGLQPVTGALISYFTKAAQVSNVIPNDVIYTSIDSAAYNDHINILGADWKVVDMATFGYAVNDSMTWFLKAKNGDIWQMYFDYFGKDATTNERLIGLKKRKVYEAPPTSIANINNDINTIILAPNPTESKVSNIIVDAKVALNNTTLTLTDLTGKVVFQKTMNINAGLQQLRLDMSRYAAGLYLVNLKGENWNNTQKLIVR